MLATRIGSALVLIPLVIVAVWTGGLAVILLAAVAAGIMAWEWTRLVRTSPTRLELGLWIGIAVAAVVVLGEFGSVAAAAVIAVGVIAGYLIDRRSLSGWFLSGYLWVVLGCAGFVFLRFGVGGRLEALWILVLVWVVDTAAYAVGRTVGGPRLAPKISPNKTWSGLVGGVVAAMIAGAVMSAIWNPLHFWVLIGILSGVLGVVEQMGDLAESYVKRRFGVKDTGALIPGHGGLLDRLDGMLAVVISVVVLNLLGMKIW